MQINALEFPSKDLIHIAIGEVCPLTHESHTGCRLKQHLLMYHLKIIFENIFFARVLHTFLVSDRLRFGDCAT